MKNLLHYRFEIEEHYRRCELEIYLQQAANKLSIVTTFSKVILIYFQ
jgi:hypothetical protein